MEVVLARKDASSRAAPTELLETHRRLVVFADDWGRHPSSAQHLVRHLLPHVHVDWINTIGTRTPQLNAQVIVRGLQKVGQWTRRASAAARDEPTTPSPSVLSPFMYPGFRTPWQRKLNAELLASFMQKNLGDLKDAVIVSTIPIVADLPHKVHAGRWIYYCVDDFSAWPGLDAQPLQTMEELLVRRADDIIVAGPNLAARIEAMGRSAQLLPHGVDLDHWNTPAQTADALVNLPRPIAVFWGLIDRRLDVAALQRLSRAIAPGTVVLVGPQQDADPALLNDPNIRFTGAQPYASLPGFAQAADVLIMPYAQLPVTQSMQPLKFKEYLATGRPVVATTLPALGPWQDCADVVSAEEFATRVLERARDGIPPAQTLARYRLRSDSWAARAREFERILFDGEP